jgi:hypothetical protein
MSSDLIPLWVTAGATVGAVVVAWTVFRRDLSERRRTDREAQARLFDVWIEAARWEDHPPPGQDPTDGGPTEMHLILSISNGSGQSVRSVDCGVYYGETKLSSNVGLGIIQPNAPNLLTKKECWFPPTAQLNPETIPSDILRGALMLDYGFGDASGNRWFRTNTGELKLLYNLSDRTKQQSKFLRLSRRGWRWVGIIAAVIAVAIGAYFLGRSTSSTNQLGRTTATSLRIAFQTEDQMRGQGNNGPPSSVLVPESCVLNGNTVTAKGTYPGDFAPEIYNRYGDVIRLYAFTGPSSGHVHGIQVADMSGELSPKFGTRSWRVTASLQPGQGRPLSCQVAAQPTQDIQLAP